MGCAFGAGSSKYMMKFWRNGKLEAAPLGSMIKEVLEIVFLKLFRWDFIIHPISFILNYRSEDREAKKNI
eukprot:CAMPEP_0170556150 /NCGR_PEP_ID=MMETSP0211-20121228/15727_1 /TAXON_ID=311385 /ORGANISM="Pseudokeronopsis sp., Strain OXSARD2" /LENGTH=69 /DNA_ID=CAMNT_0010866317 /DNA_START=106 /DNA_END=315 /DNA_ORIENTATION=-